MKNKDLQQKHQVDDRCQWPHDLDEWFEQLLPQKPLRGVPASENPDPAIRNWVKECEAQKALMIRGGTMQGLVEMTGLPPWRIFKTVVAALDDVICETHVGKSERTDVFAEVVSNALHYACHHTRSDSYKTIWCRRYAEYLKQSIREYEKIRSA